jgi:hypothetical protein
MVTLPGNITTGIGTAMEGRTPTAIPTPIPIPMNLPGATIGPLRWALR